MGFFPIRDMVFSFQLPAASYWRLPHVAQHFAAHAVLDGFAARHHAPRGRDDARSESREHVGHIVASEVDAAAWPADALDAGDHALAARTVFEEHAQHGLDALLRAGFQHLEALDISLAFENPRDLDL